MRQRLGLARAFALDPEDDCCLDEPFGMLRLALTAAGAPREVLIDVWTARPQDGAHGDARRRRVRSSCRTGWR